MNCNWETGSFEIGRKETTCFPNSFGTRQCPHADLGTESFKRSLSENQEACRNEN